MGDEVLKIVIATLALPLILSCGIANDNLSDNLKNKMVKYDKLFAQIGEKRIGVLNSKIEAIKNPFIVTKTPIEDNNKTVQIIRPTYILNAIFDTRAKINAQWYRLNSEIDDFRLVSIRARSVVIKNEHSKKELFIRKSDDNKIKFSSK